MDVARGLRRNYVDQGLTTPQQIVSKYAPASDNNNEGNWASVVSQVMGQLGGRMPMTTGGPSPATAAVTPVASMPQRYDPTPVFDPEIFKQSFRQRILSGEGLHGSDLSDLITGSFHAPPPPPAVSGAAVPPGGGATPGTAPLKGEPLVRSDKKLTMPTSWKSTHVTDGLGDQGFTHAEDIMGSPGTQVGAPEEGTVMYFHPTGAQGGGSMMIKAASGRYYWLGHIANGVPAGTKVKRGQTIALISGDHPRPHVHIDYSTTYGG